MYCTKLWTTGMLGASIFTFLWQQTVASRYPFRFGLVHIPRSFTAVIDSMLASSSVTLCRKRVIYGGESFQGPARSNIFPHDSTSLTLCRDDWCCAEFSWQDINNS